MCLKQNVKFFGAILLALLPLLIRTNTKNTCPSYFDYFLINFNERCYYNPHVYLEVPELIHKYSGSLKEYSVTTKDGYVLTMFRIFRENPKGVILLQPPISAGAIAWMSDGNESLAFSLWNMGYDVWLSNHRGASYSKNHVNLTEFEAKFWDYGFQEIALYDFEVQFDVIANETNGAQVTYIGYSMSATNGLIYAALRPEDAKRNVKTFILIAPTSVMNHFASPFKIILDIMAPFKKYLEMGEFLTMEIVRWIGNSLTIAPYIVNIFTSVVMGWTPTEMDPILFPYIFTHHGRGITNKMLYHYAQIVDSNGRFPMYDYGPDKNFKLYGSSEPPDYPLERISAPMYVLYGEKDLLATPQDVDILCDKLIPKEQLRGKIMISNSNHIDYLFSRYRQKKTLKTIYEILGDVYK